MKEKIDTNSPDGRKIIHVDCDCFFAAVETRDAPELAGKPLAVGGKPSRRGVIATANYEARKFGVHSAVSAVKAMQLCPQLILLPTNMERYREVSATIRQIFLQYTDRIEPVSLDEAYLDVTSAECCKGSATLIARDIRARVRQEVGITVSAGVAPNKFLAKVASDWRKPDGLTVIGPDAVAGFMEALPVKKIPGVGRVTTERMHKLGIQTTGDLQKLSKAELVQQFGRFGQRLSRLRYGEDDRQVMRSRPLKSISVEHTFPEDLPDHEACQQQLPMLWEKLTERLGRRSVKMERAKCFVKVRFNNFATTTLERTGQNLALSSFRPLIKEAWLRGRKPVRLLGMGIHLEEEKKSQQPSLFE